MTSKVIVGSAIAALLCAAVGGYRLGAGAWPGFQRDSSREAAQGGGGIFPSAYSRTLQLRLSTILWQISSDTWSNSSSVLRSPGVDLARTARTA